MSWSRSIAFGLVVAALICSIFAPNCVRAQSTQTAEKDSGGIGIPANTNALLPTRSARMQDIQSVSDLNRWAAYYYLYPSPDLTVKALLFAEKSGILDKNKSQAPLVAHFSQIFAQNPKMLSDWLSELSNLNMQHKAFLWKALWQANSAESKEAANALAQQFPANSSPPVLSRSSPRPIPFEKMKLSPVVLDMLWGSFFVTGDERYVQRIMVALPGLDTANHDLEKMLTACAAKWSLFSNARQHERVMNICLNARQKHPEWEPYLDAICEHGNDQETLARMKEESARAIAEESKRQGVPLSSLNNVETKFSWTSLTGPVFDTTLLADDHPKSTAQVGPLSQYCDTVLSQLRKTRSDDGALNCIVTVHISVDPTGHIFDLAFPFLAQTSSTAQEAARRRIEKLHRLRPPPTTAASPFRLEMKLVNNPDNLNVCVAGLDYGPYMVSVQRLIYKQWYPPLANTGTLTVVRFTAWRDGHISDAHIEAGSGDQELDERSLSAVQSAAPLPTLPDGSPEKVLISFRFAKKLSKLRVTGLESLGNR